jgi:hypothetical protein
MTGPYAPYDSGGNPTEGPKRQGGVNAPSQTPRPATRPAPQRAQRPGSDFPPPQHQTEGWSNDGPKTHSIKQAKREERERIARIFDDTSDRLSWTPHEIADTIRALPDKEQ